MALWSERVRFSGTKKQPTAYCRVVLSSSIECSDSGAPVELRSLNEPAAGRLIRAKRASFCENRASLNGRVLFAGRLFA